MLRYLTRIFVVFVQRWKKNESVTMITTLKSSILALLIPTQSFICISKNVFDKYMFAYIYIYIYIYILNNCFGFFV